MISFSYVIQTNYVIAYILFVENIQLSRIKC